MLQWNGSTSRDDIFLPDTIVVHHCLIPWSRYYYRHFPVVVAVTSASVSNQVVRHCSVVSTVVPSFVGSPAAAEGAWEEVGEGRPVLMRRPRPPHRSSVSSVPSSRWFEWFEKEMMRGLSFLSGNGCHRRSTIHPLIMNARCAYVNALSYNIF